MTETLTRVFHNFDRSFEDFKSASDLTKQEKANKLASQIDLLSRTQRGLGYLYERCLEIEEAGIFEGSPWIDPSKQVPSLVRGTLMSGHPNSSFEILSELRILAYAKGQTGRSHLPPEEAHAFLEEVIVHNLEFAFDELTEESRTMLTQQERRKIVNHFKFLIEHARFDGIKRKLAQEIRMVCEQRPIVTQTLRNLIQTVYQKMELDERDPVDRELQYFVNAVYFPGPLVVKYPNYSAYSDAIHRAKDATLLREAREMGNYLANTGLSNPYLAIMLKFAANKEPQLIREVLRLSPKGVSEWERYQKGVTELINDNFNVYNHRGIYGLKRMLERNLFSRRAVRAGLINLKLISIHPNIEKRILKSVVDPSGEVTAKQYLMGAMIGILGQPLGIGQGNNATCQSARGISLWAQHSPAKLINIITTVATANNLIMRFENTDIESLKAAKGLVDRLDYKLDAVSVILVPHLDKIYNEMMRRASGRGEDPHKWANPALYGHWVPTGFASAYSYLTNTIQDYDGFVRLFYASFHPEYNGGRKLVYPNPVGIYITSSKGDMLGFHAISLLRVGYNSESGDGEIRAYFLNPNNEGRQNWGQGIRPTVYGNGERHGESSLPLHEFASRIYAFHFNRLHSTDSMQMVSNAEVEKVKDLATTSWGRSYTWSNLKKAW